MPEPLVGGDIAPVVTPPVVTSPVVTPPVVTPPVVTPPADKGAQGAPETYADFKLPDGVKLEAAEVTDIQTFAKGLNLTQEQAQQLVDRDVKARGAAAEKLTADVEQVHTQWRDSSTADKEFGGDGLQANLAIANKALTQFGSPELKEMLKVSGLGNHPEAIRFFVRVGKAISEDKFVPGTKGNESAGDARRLYPNSNHAQ